MTTFGELVTSIHSSLHSFTGIHEVSSHLTSGISSSDLAVPVDSTDGIMRGIAEVEDELIYVSAADGSNLVVAPYGRGYRGTTSASHLLNTQITFDPVFPKIEIKRAVNQCIEGLFPLLYQIKTTDLAYVPTPVGYDLPADCTKVLDVKASFSGDPLNYNAPVYQWSFDSTSPEATGKALNVFEGLRPGSTLRVVYQAKFGTLVNDADTLSSVGLSESYVDVILYAVASRLIRFMDPARLQITSVENISRSAVVQAGDAGKVANQLYAMYQQRLNEERSRLLELTPPRIHFSR